MSSVNFPEAWYPTNLGSVVELKYGKSLPASKRNGEEFPVYGSNGIVGSHSAPLVKTKGIIVGRKGSYGEVQLSDSPFFPIDTTYYVDDLFSQPLKYWFYQLKALPLTELNRSTAIPGLNREDAYSQDIALPPLAEQKVIADKLDILLTQIETTKASLEYIPNILKRFRQSVLEAAVSGKMTSNDSKYQLVKVQDIWAHEIVGPKHWQQYKFSEVINLIGGNQPPKSEFSNKPTDGYIRLIQIRDYKSDAHKVYIPLTKAKRFVSKDDVMIGRYGPPIFQILRGLEGAYNVALMKAEPNLNRLNREYLYWYLQNQKLFNYVDAGSDRTAGQTGVNKKHLESYPVLVPPIEEQLEIVRRVEELFTLADNFEQKANAALDRVNNLTQSILAKAFRGELTADWRTANPDLISGENSAEALLKKIKIAQEILKKQLRTRIVNQKKESSTLMANKLIGVLEEASDWIAAQEAFRLCGVTDGTPTERIEEIYAELRDLDKAGRLQIDTVTDEQDRKLYDRLKLAGV